MCEVGVPQHLRFELHLAQPVLHHVADADDAAQVAGGVDVQISRPGKLTKQGSPYLRWALYEAAQSACRTTSPDHADYLALRERMSHQRAAITIARKLARRCFHTLRDLGDEAVAPIA